MKDYVIYSAIIGEYDNVLQPLTLHEEFDYILFSDTINDNKIGVWNIKKVKYDNPDKARVVRWIKTHPDQLVKEYKFSLWIDGNIQILTNDFYQRAIDLYNNNILISSMWHNERDCIYDESAVVAFYGLESEKVVLNWEHFLLKEHYPQHYGLFENNVIFRIHNNTIKKMDNLWWSCIEQFSRRDQLSFNYSLWKYKLKCEFYLPYGENTRNSKCVKRIYHRNTKNRALYSNPSQYGILRYYKNIYNDTKKLSIIYRKIAFYHSRHILLFFIGQYYTAQIHIRNLRNS